METRYVMGRCDRVVLQEDCLDKVEKVSGCRAPQGGAGQRHRQNIGFVVIDSTIVARTSKLRHSFESTADPFVAVGLSPDL